MPKANGTPYALWLIPQQDHYELFSNIIQALASTYNTPSFEPHVTWGSGAWPGDFAELTQEAEKLCTNMPNIQLQADGMDGKNRLLHYLYLRLLDSTQSLFDQPKQFIKACNAPIIGPHLSVMYCEQSGVLCRASVSQQLETQTPSKIEFDRVKIVTPKSGNWRDIETWETVHQFSLS